MKSMTEMSKLIALVLRHNPGALNLTLDEHGWCDVSALIERLSAIQPFTMETLEKIVSEDSKQRYSFNQDKTCIHANQGHSIPVDVELEEAEPPAVLWHGTATRFVEEIRKMGLTPRTRLYVHLSADVSTAQTVGARHGRPVVFAVDAAAMRQDGLVFYRSVNGIWMTKAVPPQYLSLVP